MGPVEQPCDFNCQARRQPARDTKKIDKSMKNPRYFCLAPTLTTLISLASIVLPTSANSIEWQRHRFLPAIENCDSQLWITRHPQCLDRVIPIQAPSLPNGPADIGQWRLVRTPGPQEGRDIVSIMHTADALRSDPDFAGLMIRCREKSSLQIALAVIRPFPPRAHPQVSIISDHTNVRLQASVLPAGTVLSLPNEAEVLAKGPWQSLSQVSFAIEGDGVTIHGIVPLEKLRAALAFLQSNCPEQ